MRKKSLFYKCIQCAHCGSNFTMRKERKTIRYICSNYHNSGNCVRIAVDEDFLISKINRRYRRELSEEEIKEVVVKIIIRSERLFDIHLTEGVPISYHERGIVF